MNHEASLVPSIPNANLSRSHSQSANIKAVASHDLLNFQLDISRIIYLVLSLELVNDYEYLLVNKVMAYGTGLLFLGEYSSERDSQHQIAQKSSSLSVI